MEQTVFAEGLNVGYEGQKRAEEDTNISGLRNLKEEVFIY